MAEIAENLHRRELPALERATLVSRWMDLTGGEKLSQVGTVSAGGRSRTGGVRAAARQLGIPKSEAHRSIKIASLSPEAQAAARDVGLDDNRSALLDAAAEKTPEAQVAALRRRAGGDDHQADASALVTDSRICLLSTS